MADASFPNDEDCLAGIFSDENLVCLGGVVASGARLTVDPSLTLRPSDVVAVVLRDDAGPYANFVNTIGSDGFAGVCKSISAANTLAASRCTFCRSLIRLWSLPFPPVQFKPCIGLPLSAMTKSAL